MFFDIKEGIILDTKYNFTNYFNTGTYYINLGVSSFEKKQIVLNRIVDILVFKSRHLKNLSMGYVDLVKSSSATISNKKFSYNLKEE